MKNLFSSVLDKRTGTEEFYGEPFITNRIDAAQEQEIAQRRAEIDSFEKKRGVPVWYTALEYLALLAFLFCFFIHGRPPERVVVCGSLWNLPRRILRRDRLSCPLGRSLSSGADQKETRRRQRGAPPPGTGDERDRAPVGTCAGHPRRGEEDGRAFRSSHPEEKRQGAAVQPAG